MTKNWIIVDLDGTLCDCAHRVHWAQAKQWDEFHSGIPEDKPHTEAVQLLKWASFTHKVLLCTGRDERHRIATEKWLHSQDVALLVDHLLMRPDNDRSPDHELKLRMTDEFFGSREKALESVLLVLEDRDKVVEAWRDAGFRCWQVAAGNY